jgi:histidinol-phosphatase (PHP family)
VPWFSYHGGHSGQFCRHAKDTLAAIVERAIAAGFTHYGLTEHCPRYREQDLVNEESDLGPPDLIATFERYVAEALALRDRYADRIEILVGFETERLPPESWPERMRTLRESAAFDYIVGSVHDVDGRFVDYKPEETRALAAALGGTEALQIRYFDAVADLVETLRPEVVGHIDLVRKFELSGAAFGPRVLQRIERALEAVLAHRGVLDVNCGAYRRGFGPVYPAPVILRRAREMGIPVTLGDDSHGVDTVGVGLDACLRAIAEAGYATVCYLSRRDGCKAWQSATLAEVARRR